MSNAKAFSRNLSRRIETGARKRRVLALIYARDREIFHRRLEQPMKIEFRAQMQEHAAQPNRRPIHQNELARHRHRALLPQRLLHLEGLAAAIFAWLDA